MKVAILGGTGKLGLGFAVRLQGTSHDFMIGSRDAAKAEEAARTIGDRASAGTNESAALWCDAALVAVPYQGHRALLEPLKDQLRGKIIIDATVPIDPANILQIKTESGKSAAEETAAIVSDASVFGAFHTISHRVLRQPGALYDVLFAGPPDRRDEVVELIRTMGMRPVNAGPLEVVGHLERMTVLLLSVNKANKVKESSFKVVGV